MTPMQMLRRAVGYLSDRYAALLVSLLGLLATYPFIGRGAAVRAVLDLLWAVVLASLLRAVWGQTGIRRLAIVLGVPAIAAGALAGSGKVAVAYPVAVALRAALLMVIVSGLFRTLLERRKITMDAVLGACCIYLLFGIGYSGIYGLILWADPVAFRFPESGPGSIDLELIYFSLITMTTVGYGDIAPVSGPARILSAIEGLLGQLYIAVVIARMVSLEMAHRRTDAAP